MTGGVTMTTLLRAFALAFMLFGVLILPAMAQDEDENDTSTPPLSTLEDRELPDGTENSDDAVTDWDRLDASRAAEQWNYLAALLPTIIGYTSKWLGFAT